MHKMFELMATLQTPEQQQLLRDIVGEITPPVGFDSWKAAALDERNRRVDLERQLAVICARHYDKYTTNAGESLAGIAHRQLKDEDRWVEIEAANRHLYVHKDANDYYPAGAVILLPRTPMG